MSAKTLIIAEAANPEWASVPLVGWSLASAIARIKPAHLVTHVRNRDAIRKAGLEEGRDFTAVDSDALARPLWRASNVLRGKAGAGWTTGTAFAALAYYYFEHLVWRRFEDRIRSGEFDLVHRVTPLSPTIPSTLAQRCQRAGVPFVIGPLNGGVAWPEGFGAERRREREWLSYVRGAYRWMPAYKSTLECSAALIAGSLDTLAQIPAQLHRKCIYLPENAVDPERFSLVASPSQGDEVRACFVGRLVPYKGPDVALEALAPMLRGGRLRFDIVGDGPLMPAIRMQLLDTGLQDAVTLHGWVEHRRVQEIMCRSQLFVFPSVREFGGGVVLEAMALGLVPVVVDYGGPGELVMADTGIKVPIGMRADIVRSLREKVEDLCSRPEIIASKSRSARQRVHTKFTWRSKAEQILQIYDWVLGRNAQKPQFFPGRA